MKKKIYLAIPFSGIEEKSFKAATEIAGLLISKGYIVFSPITHSHPINKCNIVFLSSFLILCIDFGISLNSFPTDIP